MLLNIGSFIRDINVMLMYYGFSINDARKEITLREVNSDTEINAGALALQLDKATDEVSTIKADYFELEHDNFAKLETFDFSPYMVAPTSESSPKETSISDRTYNTRMAIMAALALVAATGTIVSTVWGRSTLARRECIEATLESIGSEGNECVDLHNESEDLCVDASRMLLRCVD